LKLKNKAIEGGDFMKTMIKTMLYLIIVYSLGQTFDMTGQHSLAIMYFSLLGVITYEAMKLDSKGGQTNE